MPHSFKHEIRDDIPQLLVLEFYIMKPPQLSIFNLIVRDKRDRLAICIERPLFPAMQGHDADAETAAIVGLGQTAPGADRRCGRHASVIIEARS
jgi:hypothetical protein